MEVSNWVVVAGPKLRGLVIGALRPNVLPSCPLVGYVAISLPLSAISSRRLLVGHIVFVHVLLNRDPMVRGSLWTWMMALLERPVNQRLSSCYRFNRLSVDLRAAVST